MIQTVTGPISPDDLGICAVHEHLCIDLSLWKKDPDTSLDEPDTVIGELKRFFRAGGRSMVEVTNTGMGRNVRFLTDVSRRTGVRIIASTGFYKEPYLPEEVKEWDRDRFAEHLVHEMQRGIGDTGVLPGVIGEVGSSLERITPMEEELLLGAGMAAMQTGLSVTTHTTLGTMAMKQVELLNRTGLSTDRMIIGHQDLNRDREEVLAVVQAGAFVGLDTVGKTNYRADEERLELLLFLWERGYGSHLLLSADVTRKSHFRCNGGPGYDVVLREFVPKLRQAGLEVADIQRLLVDNPARALSKRRETGE